MIHSRDQPRVFNDADTAFHVAIAQAAGNQLFSDLTGPSTSLRKSIFSSFSRVDDPQALMSQLQAQHHQILDAIVAGARTRPRVTEEHIRFAASRLPGLQT